MGFWATLFGKNYNPYILDCIAGGGWLPAYDYILRVVPYKPDLKPFFSQSEETRKLAFMEYDDFVYKQYEQRKFAHTIDYNNLCCFNIIPSVNDNITVHQMQAFWDSLSLLREPVIFEIVVSGKQGKIAFQMLCNLQDRDLIAGQLISLFPGINPAGKDHLLGNFEGDFIEDFNANYWGRGVNFGLTNHYSYPLKAITSFDRPDLLNPVFVAVDPIFSPHIEAKKYTGAVIQGMVYPSKDLWQTRLKWISQLTKEQELPYELFGKCPASQQLNHQLFALSLKMMVFYRLNTETEEASELINRCSDDLIKAFTAFNGRENGLAWLHSFTRSNLPKSYRREPALLSQGECVGILKRNTYRHGFILNSRELTTLLHFPPKTLSSPKLLKQERGQLKAPDEFIWQENKEGPLVGINKCFGLERKVYLPDDLRIQHTYT